MSFERQSGVFLHVSSLPGPDGIGTLGEPALEFIDYLAAADQSLWQTCPIGPTDPGKGNSPYSGYSGRAGNPLFINLDALVEAGWVDDFDRPAFDDREVEYERVIEFKRSALRQAFAGFEERADEDERSAFDEFCDQHADWLDDYALFRALDERFVGIWIDWPADAKYRDPEALERYRDQEAEAVRFRQFLQWVFEQQWQELKSYATERGIDLVGDMPIYVGTNSVDVWANPEIFKLDEDLQPVYVSGVPPDDFSDTGQLWGTPVYDWEAVAERDYDWWIQRFAGLLERFDVFRIDHFKGFESYYQVPAEEDTAIEGEWVSGPGQDVFRAVQSALGDLPIIVEDLGEITDATNELRDAFGFPGMAVAAMADWCDPDNKHHPAMYDERTVVYTSTHDSKTTMGWYEDLSWEQKDCLHYAIGHDGGEIHWDVIETVWDSDALMTLAQFQDFHGLGADHRFNVPGTAEGNWRWRVLPEELDPAVADRLATVTQDADRA